MENSSHEVRPTRRLTGPVSLLMLGHCECKWPLKYDESVIGGYLFCGRATDGHSYCITHQALSWPRGGERAKHNPA
jgi:hypothetical protein